MKEQHTSTSLNTENEHKKWFLKHYGLQEKSNATIYKESYEEMMEKYAPFVTTAATLTFKTSDIIEPNKITNKKKRYTKFKSIELVPNHDLRLIKFTEYLDDDKINSSIRYFTKRINHYCFGNKTKHKNSRDDSTLLILFFVEGDGIRKRKHVHLAMGNIPYDLLESINITIRDIWRECDFSNRELDVTPTYNTQGWLNYEVKDVGYRNKDVFNVVQSCIPRFIENSACT